MKEYECPAVPDNLRPVLASAHEELIASSTETPLRQRFFVVLEELFNNVALHAYGNKPAGPVRLTIKASQDYVELTVMDRGEPFDPTAYDDASRLHKLAAFQLGGAGIFLVKSLSSALSYRRENGWNIVTAVMELPHGSA
ncbi:MAG: ATP-binding protein [Desulfovibrio sp.]|nr:ATP-binding protein [Desulfovibrio sp.]